MNLIGALHTALDPSEAQVQATAITAVSAVVVALVGIVGARLATHPKTPKKDPDRKSAHESLLTSYSGEQNEFIKLVIEDSKFLHARLDEHEAEITKLKTDRVLLIGAFGRYITKLANSWGSGGKMPYPDEEDISLLEETLPADWRRRSKTT